MRTNEKKGLMTQYPCSRGRAFVCKNIGDYVQSVASRQYIDNIDEYVEQEEADKYYPEDKKPIRLIMNGWFQWRAENWPPSEFVHPLLISMHISPLKAEQLLSPAGIEFLKKNSPVGCRDLFTQNLLEKHGIPAYFSACLTLTLGKKFKIVDAKRNGVCFVDPFFEIPPLYKEVDGQKILDEGLFNDFIQFYAENPEAINSLAERQFFKQYSPTGFLDRDKNPYRPYYKAACFFKSYSKKFSKDLLLNAEYITHWLDVDMSKDTNDDLLNIAEGLVKKYASSKLVITSRIHAGLPCLGVGTPVIFIADDEVTSEKGTFNVPGRLGGLLDFFRIINFEKGNFTSDDEVLKKIDIIDLSTSFENKNNWRPYAKDLEYKCTEFMK